MGRNWPNQIYAASRDVLVRFNPETALLGVLEAPTVAEAVQVLQACDEIDFVTFHLMNSYKAQMDNPFVRTNYPSGWVSHYLLNNLVRSDPVVRHSGTATAPFNWAEITLHPEEMGFMQTALAHGVGISGYTLPCTDEFGRRSLLSLNSHLTAEDWAAFLAQHGAALQNLAQDLHVKGVAEAFASAGEIPALSPREHECLRWTSRGKSYSEIAIILDLSEHTVRSYLKVARIKLDSVTLAQAVTKATQLGLL